MSLKKVSVGNFENIKACRPFEHFFPSGSYVSELQLTCHKCHLLLPQKNATNQAGFRD